MGRRFRARAAGDAPGRRRSRPISRPGSTATAATSSRPATTSARTSTSSSTRCCAPGASTAPAANCTSTTPRSTTPRRCKLACTQLNIKLLHRPPRDPPAGGLIERFFQTLPRPTGSRGSRQPTAHARRTEPRCWPPGSRSPTTTHVHSETGRDAYANATISRLALIRTRRPGQRAELLPPARAAARSTRTSRTSASTSCFFAVDPKLRGDRVIVEYDPFVGRCRKSSSTRSTAATWAWADGISARREVIRSRPAPAQPEPIEPPLSRCLAKPTMRRAHEQQRQAGIDYHSARQRNVWSLVQLRHRFRPPLGTPGRPLRLDRPGNGSPDRLSRPPRSRHTKDCLRQAFAQAESPTIPDVLFQLQSLLHERND